MTDWITELYNSYVELCMNKDDTYVGMSSFKLIHDEARKEVTKVHDRMKNHDKGNAVYIKQIDSNWLYWVEIQKNKTSSEWEAVVNFITPTQYKMLFNKIPKEEQQ